MLKASILQGSVKYLCLLGTLPLADTLPLAACGVRATKGKYSTFSVCLVKSLPCAETQLLPKDGVWATKNKYSKAWLLHAYSRSVSIFPLWQRLYRQISLNYCILNFHIRVNYLKLSFLIDIFSMEEQWKHVWFRMIIGILILSCLFVCLLNFTFTIIFNFWRLKYTFLTYLTCIFH